MPRVLLIETDRQLAKNLQSYLELNDFIVDIHSDIQNAIMSTDTQCPDVIILDLILAGRSGIEFLYELRSYPEWQSVPVIATGHISQDELSHYGSAFEQLNVSAYLPKHSAFDRLAGEIRKLLQPAKV